MHNGICITYVLTCHSARHANSCVCLGLLCFALQVLVKPHERTQHSAHTHTDRSTHGLTAVGTDVVIPGCVCTESRLAAELVCVRVMTLGFYARMSGRERRVPSGFQKVTKNARRRGWFSRKGGWKTRCRVKTQYDRDHSHTLTRMHTHTKEMSHQWVCERALRGSNCIWWEI